MFVHTSAPVTFDFGKTFDQFATVYTGDDQLDLFLFLGEPKEILSAYTELTGRARMPPLWSFGLWMSRITYKSEAEVRAVAARLRELAIPCDVIHLDTGWFETDWQCDYQFSPSRFPNPTGMISDLRDQGFRISLWQYPYFTAKNRLYDEIVANGYLVRDQGGTLPAEDAVLDFSNPEAVAWYQGLLEGLLKQGVGAIKVDFGEDAPWRGVYASGRTGYYEHNLYPLRYNQAAAEVTRRVTGEDIIWARSAWAGSQRYPLHWGGDAENTDSAMAATLRGGLSFGMSGFTFWSHDAGGFVNPPPRDLYHRWLAFAALSSHTRCHGAPPREPWEYDETFIGQFRDIVNLRYSLLPYLYAQGKQSAEQGWPVLRSLFHEFPEDPASWLIEDQYLLGSDLLVAPLFESGGGRRVYLPPGTWYDYQSGRPYAGGRWHPIEAAPLPIVVLARDHAAIPCMAVAPSTEDLDWSRLDLRVFDSDGTGAKGLVCLPDEELHPLAVAAGTVAPTLAGDPLRDRVRWNLLRSGPGTP
jgi:alpha-D-xyloside xylohydrolase